LVLCLGRTLPPTLWAAPLKVLLWLAGPVALWTLGFVSPQEKAFIGELLNRIRGRRAAGFTPAVSPPG
jgi:hypothetical protein